MVLRTFYLCEPFVRHCRGGGQSRFSERKPGYGRHQSSSGFPLKTCGNDECGHRIVHFREYNSQLLITDTSPLTEKCIRSKLIATLPRRLNGSSIFLLFGFGNFL